MQIYLGPGMVNLISNSSGLTNLSITFTPAENEVDSYRVYIVEEERPSVIIDVSI